jgi:hypothetical protein
MGEHRKWIPTAPSKGPSMTPSLPKLLSDQRQLANAGERRFSPLTSPSCWCLLVSGWNTHCLRVRPYIVHYARRSGVARKPLGLPGVPGTSFQRSKGPAVSSPPIFRCFLCLRSQRPPRQKSGQLFGNFLLKQLSRSIPLLLQTPRASIRVNQ